MTLARSRLLPAVLALCLTLAAAACGSGTGASGTKSRTTLVFWHYFTDRAALFQKFADTYEKQTGVHVKLELIGGDTLGQKFQAAAQAGTLPDLAAAWTGIGDKLAPYAKNGQILDLDDAMKGDWGDQFPASMKAATSFPDGNTFGVTPGQYLVPLDSNNMQFLYNKTLFDKAGISSPPQTFDEMITDSGKLAKAGAAPFAAGFGSWPLDSFATVYEWNIIGEDNLKATYAGTMPYTAQPWIDLLTFFQRIGKSGMLAKGALSDDDPAAESLFVNGQAGMIFDGSWALGVFKQQNPGFTDYGVFFPPSAGANPVRIPGGVGAMAFVVGTSKHKAEAVKFLRWLTDEEQQSTYATTSLNLPANTKAAAGQHLTENLSAFSTKMDALVPTLPASMPAAVDTTMTKGMQRIMAGQDTPAHVAQLMQKAAKSGKAQ